jgi:hypothetical protein
MFPDGLYELRLVAGVEIAFNFAVTLLDRSYVAPLLKVVDVLLGHPGAARQQLGHRVQIAQGVLAHRGPRLGDGSTLAK